MNEAHITFTSGGTTLAGTITTPETTGPHPVALLVAGSGPLDRDGNHKRLPLGVSRDLAEHLANHGWASLRYDKRGVGESAGDYLSTGFFEELTDVEAALAYLRERSADQPIVAIGHSAGAVQAGELAAHHPDLAGAVLLATSAKTGDETLRWQAAEMQDVIVPAAAKAMLKLFRTSVVKQQAKAIDKLSRTTGDVERIQLAKVNAKWMREYIAHDPEPALRAAKVPLLAITGAKDVQVDAEDIGRILEIAPPGTEGYAVPDVDHILRHEPAAVSNPRRYSKQRRNPIDSRVLDTLVEWLGRLPASPRAGTGSTHQ